MSKKSTGSITGASSGSKGLFTGDRDYINDDVEVLAVDQRTRLLKGNEKLDDHTDRLARTHQLGLQTEEIGREVQVTLDEQGETIRGARDKVRHINQDMDTTRTILFGMFRRMITNKALLVFMILLMIVGIGVIVYLKWIQKIKF